MTLSTNALTFFVFATYHRLTFAAPTVFQQSALLISNLFISNPFQADPTSSYNSTLSLVVTDADYPDLKPVHCQIEWKAGVGPPDASHHQCENATMRAWFPESTFNGVQTFQLQFAHTVMDTSFGECPQYCYLSKFAAVNLTYPGTMNWRCDTGNATCEQVLNTTIPAPIYLAIG